MATNKAYWEQREKKHIEQLNKADEDYSSKLQGHYDETIKDINNDINEFYVKYANKEGISLAEAKKKVANEDVKAFQSTAKKMVKDKDFSPDANEKLRLYNATMRINRLEMLKAKIGLELTGMNTKQSASLKAKLTKEYQSEVERQAGVLGENKLDNVAAKVDTVVNGSFYNATFSQRIWANQDSLKARIDKHLTDWLIRGDKPTDKLAKDLAKEMGVSFNIADRLMKTESSRISVEAEKNSLSEAGVKYYWIVGEADACDVCKELIRKSHTKPIKVDDATIGDNTPPIHARCRCTMSAASDDWEEWNQWLQDNGYSTSPLWSKRSKHAKKQSNNVKKNLSKNDFKDDNPSYSKYTTGNLTDDQIESIKSYYQGTAYDVNSDLRHGDVGLDDDYVKSISDAINNNVAKKNLTLYRKVVSGDVQKRTMNYYANNPEMAFPTLKVGDIFENKGFMSTAKTTNGDRFDPNSSLFEGDIEFHITVPQGYHALDIQPIADKDLVGGISSEEEVLLNHGAKFEITDIKKKKLPSHVSLSSENGNNATIDEITQIFMKLIK
ncbi:ADP-ribosyltransferase [Paucilactobacillus sp. N302-9]